MPIQVTEFRCLLISPSDVIAEREALTDAVTRWNALVGKALAARVELIRWETHSTPATGRHPQEELNSQLLEDCDLGIAVFWSRLGTATPTSNSGSVDEIESLLAQNRRVMIYFKTGLVPPSSAETGQFEKLKAFRNSLESRALIGEFSTPDELSYQVTLHLTSQVVQLLSSTSTTPGSCPKEELATGQRPDVRVSVATSHAIGPPFGPTAFLCIKIGNHSPMAVFLGNIGILPKKGGLLVPTTDSFTGRYQQRQVLRPGDSLDFHVAPAQLLRNHDIDDLDRAFVRDQIGRRYESDPSEFKRVLTILTEGETTR
jgi:hypothetical protein